jgi:phage terminase small subunit
MNQATMLMNTLQAELGFTPSARAHLGVPGSGFAEPASAHEMFDTILPDGKIIPYGRR